MAEWPQLAYSKSQVKKAGKILRTHATTILEHSEDEVAWAESVARNWRRAHAEAENWAQMGCRSRLATLGIAGNVTQRLKELPTIVDKLVREGNRVQLNTMEDVAGVRAVVATLGEVRELEQQWLHRPMYEIHRHRDFIAEPQGSGYRAIHLVMRHRERLVEIQLRTTIQNAWANLVEDIGTAGGYALKNGEGPPELLDHLADLADKLAGIDDKPPLYPEVPRQAAVDLIDELRSMVIR